MGRILLRIGVGLLVAAALTYMGDWAVWRIKVAHGGGTRIVTVTRMVVASLKGNKQEYYPAGSEDVTCSVSMFPWVGGGACWWVEKNHFVLENVNP